jgi:cell division protein FtsL
MSDYIQQPQMPKWLRDFANLELEKSAQTKHSSVEDMVKDLRSRVGLDFVTGQEDFQQEKVSHKEASNKYSSNPEKNLYFTILSSES